MTRPGTRACRKTNSSDGGFVRKVPFFLFFKLIFPFLFFSNVFSLSHPFFEWVHWQLKGPPNYPGEICSLFLGCFFAENDSIQLC